MKQPYKRRDGVRLELVPLTASSLAVDEADSALICIEQ